LPRISQPKSVQAHRTVEVVFSPKLYEHKLTKDNFIAVVVDILRASTSICAGLQNGVQEIIPVAGLEQARAYQGHNALIACERNGHQVEFADMGNSASEFLAEKVRGRQIVFSTTNGTRIIDMARDADRIAIGSFVNLDALTDWLTARDKNVVIFCAAWKNLFNLEDSVFAGALAEKLLSLPGYTTHCDATRGAVDLWQAARHNLESYLSRASHRTRLKHLVSDEDFRYTLQLNTSRLVPVVEGHRIVAHGPHTPESSQ
jgi:2-phosphosulfolactate phosphatase